MSRLFAFLVFLFVSTSISEAQTRIPRPFGSASVSRSEIAFSFAGDLWIVDRSGGEARRLTSSPNKKAYPVFSPDGSEIAFGMEVNSNWDVSIPMGVIEGPRVMIINEISSSGGDGLPFMFRAARLGTLVGRRTGGATVGGGGKELLDGGRMTVSDQGSYDHTKGVWTAENLGVPPDIEVDILPADWRAGRDPQLERAVQIALEELRKNPPPDNKRPKFPVYK
jgi:C-terminal processing protease CtpA/Prc